MNYILQGFLTFFEQFGFRGIAAILSALVVGFGGLQLIWKLIGILGQKWQQRRLLKDLFPFYTAQEIQRATEYYVETKCQNVAPSREEELRSSRPFSAKERIIPFFLKEAFKPLKDDCQFYIVLADSGMGKTTFLINLYLRYIDQFFTPLFTPQYQIKLFPLAFPEIDKKIEAIPDDVKRQTILLLDAFDEDLQAVQDYKARLRDLIQKVLYFREVVITCRTQFFPSEVEEPGQSGILRFGPEGGDRVFHKFYISPFDDKDIRTYLRKRFGWWRWRKKRKARQIVTSCPNLMVRPMLLSHIEDLLQREQSYTATYQVYEELIHRWIEREAQKVRPDRRKRYVEELFRFSREIAVDIYHHREERKGSLLIPGEAIKPFAENHGINLEDMEMKARSLLNRNAPGDYKFSHKSILEYFLAEEALFNTTFRKELDFESMNQAAVFFDEMIWEKLTVPFFEQGGLNGEYALKDGKTKVLTKLPVKILSEISTLKLQEWKEEDDVLLFRGLKNLERVGFQETQLMSEQKNELQHALPNCKIFQVLRSESLTVSTNEFSEVFRLDNNQRPLAYIQNDYEAQDKVVIDHATGLIWQKSGSDNSLTYKDAQKYVKELNRQRFAGYSEWRLSTIPELMSLLEPEKQSNGLYIDPIFDKPEGYPWYWSADRLPADEGGSSGAAWDVDFYDGDVYWNSLNYGNYVRCVCS